MIFIPQSKNVSMIMWEKTMLPDSVRSVDEKGKTVFTKTGTKTEYTTYTFRDSFGDKLVFTSKNNSYRTWEGKKVIIALEVNFDEFNRKNKVSLNSVEPDNSTDQF